MQYRSKKIDGGLLSKHFLVSDEHDRLVIVYTNGSGPIIKIATMPGYTGIKKTFKNLLQNQKANDLATRYETLGMRAIPSFHKLLFWVDLNLLTACSNFIPGLNNIYSGKLHDIH